MNICIDIRSLETGGKFRGYGYYIKNLVSNVIALDSANNYSFIIYDKSNPLYEQISRRGFKTYCIDKPKVKPRFWWIYDQFQLPSLIKKVSPDAFISLDNNLPLLITFSKKIKSVVAVHDLIPLVLKDKYLPPDRKIDFWLKMISAKRANSVLTISNFSKNDIVRHLNIPSKRVKYIYESTDQIFKKSSVEKTRVLTQKYAGGAKYLMTVGHFFGSDPRKNYIFLLEAFAKFVADRDDGLKLLFVGQCGGRDNEYSRITARAKELNLSERVAFTDYVSDEDLAGLYGGAQAFVYPTKYEGFGLPVLQAMSCECPVIVANNTSIPEVAGSAAELFETNNQSSLLNALRKVLGGAEKYRALGLENVKRFSWEKSAREFIEFIEGFAK